MGVPIITRFAGVNVAASVAAANRPPVPSHEVARSSNQNPRPAPPTGMMAAGVVRADRMEIHVLDDDTLDRVEEGRFLTWMEAQFNPTELAETIGTVWNDIVIPGLSHERGHYSHTKSVPFKFTLVFDAIAYMQEAQVDQFEKPGITEGVEYVERAQNFLRSLGYASVQTGAPPRVLFFWPNFLSITAKLEQLEMHYTGWVASGHMTRFSAQVSLKEIRDVHMSRTDVLVAGNQRSTPRVRG